MFPIHIFWKEAAKIAAASGVPPLDPHVVTPAYCYSTLSSTFYFPELNTGYFMEKEQNVTTVNVLLLQLLGRFFTSNSVVMLMREQKYFAPGRRMP